MSTTTTQPPCAYNDSLNTLDNWYQQTINNGSITNLGDGTIKLQAEEQDYSQATLTYKWLLPVDADFTITIDIIDTDSLPGYPTISAYFGIYLSSDMPNLASLTLPNTFSFYTYKVSSWKMNQSLGTTTDLPAKPTKLKIVFTQSDTRYRCYAYSNGAWVYDGSYVSSFDRVYITLFIRGDNSNPPRGGYAIINNFQILEGCNPSGTAW